jgi:hypothetical protein
LQKWAEIVNYGAPVENDWPAELPDLPRELHYLSEKFPHTQPVLTLSAIFELHLWMTHYAKQYVPDCPQLFSLIWLHIMHERYDVANWLCRPLHTLLADEKFRKYIGRKSLKQYSMAPPPEFDCGWDDVYKKINPAIVEQLKTFY